MIKLLPLLLAVVVCGPQSRAEDDDRIHVGQLAKQLPMGLLKVPLGTVVTVKCRSFSPTDEEKGYKDAFWERQVEIIEANGQVLRNPIRIKWEGPSSSPLKKPPVGTTIEVLGYETGSFHGIPDTAGRKDLPIAAGTGFAFHSEFVPMKLVTQKP